MTTRRHTTATTPPRRHRLIVAAAVIALAACGSTTPTEKPIPFPTVVAPSPSPSGTAGSPSPTSEPTATPAPTPAGPFPLAVVAHVTDLRQKLTSAEVVAAVASGAMVVPCGLASLSIAGAPVDLPSACTTAADIPAALAEKADSVGLLPAGLVDPRVKVLLVDGADLFGNTVIRTAAYPVMGTGTAAATDLMGAAVAYDANDIRTIVSTGDTCPDRTVSLEADIHGKGWDWTLQGGTARYTGGYIDHLYDFPVVTAVRTGKQIGAVWNLIHDADIAVNDFECPMIKNFSQHNSGTFFTINPEIANTFAKVGMDFASLGSNHGTDLGSSGIRQTLDYLDAAGVKYSGMGMNLEQAMTPAVFDVRGLKIAFVSWDSTGQSRAATATDWGELHSTTPEMKATVALARSQADLVIAMPQWNWPEYSAPFSKTALNQRNAWFAAGVDQILGSGTHWAGAMSITQPDPAKGWQLAVTSHGNFLFGQLWSRQTMEGVIYEVTFRGTQLVQVRVHPYIVMEGAQPNLVDPTTDGKYVQRQIFDSSDLP